MKCDFGTISERDMDMLFLNAFSTDKGFLKLFIGKTDLPKDDYVVWAVSGIVFAVLLVLLAIESHQDKVLNEIAIEENKKNGEI